MNAIRTFSALVILGLTTACSNTGDGVKKDADIAAEKTAEAASSAGAAVGGALETGQVKSAIMADKRVDAGDINVDTDEDKKTVTLRGTVKTDAQIIIAGDIAASKATGYSIRNNLTVKP